MMSVFSISLVKFANRGDDQFIVVGTAKELVLNPRTCAGGFLHVYQLSSGGDKLEFVHKTPVDDVPGALAPFQVPIIYSNCHAQKTTLAMNGFKTSLWTKTVWNPLITDLSVMNIGFNGSLHSVYRL